MPSMRRILVAVAACGLTVLLYPAVYLYTAPAAQAWWFVFASLVLAAVIGVVVQPPHLSSLTALLAVGFGAFAGTVVSMEILSLREYWATADWWRSAMAVSVIAGLFQGALAGAIAGTVGLAFRARRTQVAETGSA